MQPMSVGCSVDMEALHPKLRCSVLLPKSLLHLVLKTWLTDVTSFSTERNKGKQNVVTFP